MTQKDRLVKEMAELDEKCRSFENKIFYEGNKEKRSLTSDEWLDIWTHRSKYLINRIELMSVEPKSEYAESCLRFIVEFENGDTRFIDSKI